MPRLLFSALARSTRKAKGLAPFCFSLTGLDVGTVSLSSLEQAVEEKGNKGKQTCMRDASITQQPLYEYSPFYQMH